MNKRTGLRLAALLGAMALVVAACGDDSGEGGDDEFVLGVSNTLVGNGWREQMICSIYAEASASGVVSEVVTINENGGPTEQIAAIESLISQGVDAIILNPTDPTALNDAIGEAIAQDIVVVSVDSAVTAEGVYNVTNDQEAYGYLGAKWLFEELGGAGTVAYMRGIDGVPADTDRDTGFQRALSEYPDIEVVSEVFTGWDGAAGGELALDILTTTEVDGIWTSGIDLTVVDQFEVANVDPVPVVGADNNGFIAQMIDGQPGVAVTNPPAIGGVGTSIAISALQGESPESTTLLTPATFSFEDTDQLEELYDPDQNEWWSTYVEIDPYTSYEAADVTACQAPGADS
ncbi:MAG TPA: substrate-binding domain-containing protein [Acidimicrobiia bacterium]|nr:substrate-binding domain-containing protein [Acidimicrobiia bacterium]